MNLGRTAVVCLSQMLRDASQAVKSEAEAKEKEELEEGDPNAALRAMASGRAAEEEETKRRGRDMGPAIDFVELVCEKLSKVSLVLCTKAQSSHELPTNRRLEGF